MITLDTVSVAALLALVRAQIGIPYVWGGAKPGGFDCSGLVMWVYRQFGVDMARTTYEQVQQGTEVTLSDIRPGDLVFFDTEDRGAPDTATHVGIYVGDGRMVNAPREGDVVRETELTSNNYWTSRMVAIRRVFDSEPPQNGNNPPSIPWPQLPQFPQFPQFPTLDRELGLRMIIGGLGAAAILIGMGALIREPAVQIATTAADVASVVA